MCRTYAGRMRGEGFYAEQLKTMFQVANKRAGFKERGRLELSAAHFKVPSAQGELF